MNDDTGNFACPHCGETSFNLYGSAVRQVSLIPPGEGRPARAELDEADVDYDLFTCTNCGEEVEPPRWAMSAICAADKEAIAVNKNRFVPSFSQIVKEAVGKS